MKTPHKHADIIKAWADGAEIEQFAMGNEWCLCEQPIWNPSTRYRIKPEPKPDTVYYLQVVGNSWGLSTEKRRSTDNLKLTFDGETGKLKSAEVL